MDNRYLIPFMWLTFMPVIVHAQFGFMIAGHHGSANHYFDLDPDTLISHTAPSEYGDFSIDINGDGLVDVSFFTASSAWQPQGCQSRFIKVIPENNAEIGLLRMDTTLICPPTDSILPVTNLLNYGDTINADLEFTSEENFIYKRLIGCVSECPYDQSIADWGFTGTSPIYYLPVKLDSSFGWIGLRRYYGSALFLRDYAFEEPAETSKVTESDHEFRIYPVPSNGVVKLDFGEFFNENAEVKVFTLAGKLIHSSSVRNTAYQIDFDHKGVFVVKVITGNNMSTHRIIIH